MKVEILLRALRSPLTLEVTTTLKAKAFHADYDPSPTTSGLYTIQVPSSAASPTGGTYAAGQTVTVSNTLQDAVIHYTIDGATPTEDDPSIESGASLTLLADLTLKMKAFKTGCEPSDVVTETYTVTGAVTAEVIGAEGVFLAPSSRTTRAGRGGRTTRAKSAVLKDAEY